MSIEIINLTPHAVTIDTGAYRVTLQPSGKVARVSQRDEPAGELNDIPLFVQWFGEVVDLPPEQVSIHALYIVSGLVRSALPDRLDLVTPTGLVRDEAGVVIGCRGLACHPRLRSRLAPAELTPPGDGP